MVYFGFSFSSFLLLYISSIFLDCLSFLSWLFDFWLGRPVRFLLQRSPFVWTCSKAWTKLSGNNQHLQPHSELKEFSVAAEQSASSHQSCSDTFSFKFLLKGAVWQFCCSSDSVISDWVLHIERNTPCFGETTVAWHCLQHTLPNTSITQMRHDVFSIEWNHLLKFWGHF